MSEHTHENESETKVTVAEAVKPEEKVEANNDDSNNRLYIILAHVGGIIVSFIAPLVVMLITENSLVKSHAKSALNFQLTLLVGYVIAFVLTFVLIGMLLYPVLFVLGIVFPIVGAVKSSNNIKEVYKYPLAIPFLK
jgi:uncharacterized protein